MTLLGDYYVEFVHNLCSEGLIDLPIGKCDALFLTDCMLHDIRQIGTEKDEIVKQISS